MVIYLLTFRLVSGESSIQDASTPDRFRKLDEKRHLPKRRHRRLKAEHFFRLFDLFLCMTDKFAVFKFRCVF